MKHGNEENIDSTLEQDYMRFFVDNDHVPVMRPSEQDDLSLEQPPVSPYVPSYTTYGIGEEAICDK